MTRTRLPGRRPALTRTLAPGAALGQATVATAGLDPASGRPRELFLRAAKEGSALSALLDDAAVVVSLALQHGIPARHLGRSVGRLPEAGDAFGPARAPASALGAALDWLAELEAAAEAEAGGAGSGEDGP